MFEYGVFGCGTFLIRRIQLTDAIEFADDEKEYWEEYKECLNDGEIITSSERR